MLSNEGAGNNSGYNDNDNNLEGGAVENGVIENGVTEDENENEEQDIGQYLINGGNRFRKNTLKRILNKTHTKRRNSRFIRQNNGY